MINDLINDKNIEIHLQPILSIKDKKVFAYEALTRATDRYAEAISPLYLFEQAKKEGVASQLDEYVRELALMKFQNYYHEDKELLLFLKFDSWVVEKELANDFISTIYKYNIPAKNIVIEVKEDKIKNTHALKSFIDTYKKHGHFIAIDDFGTTYSSFHRLEFIQPDIVKIDRSLIYNVHNNFINSELLSAISNMCNQIGAIVIAEGVEHKDEVLSCIEKGVDLFQGYWFCRVKEEIKSATLFEIEKSIEYIGRMYKGLIEEGMDEKKLLIAKSQKLLKQSVDILEENGFENVEKLEEIIDKNPKIQAIYLINEKDGLQVGETVIHSEEKYLFKPTKAGKDHTLREYYFITREATRGDYLSAKYVSKASGSICRTYAANINYKEKKYIICFDILD
jgi:EAL domain-containing protein (putative c-di-GMP-specific phosphodiesterase class I)